MSQFLTIAPFNARRGATLDPAGEHVAWFDYAKGICIIFVVMMHSTLGVGEAFAERGLAPEGFMHWIVAFAKPFRMPDFFVLSGLFLSLAIGRGWMHYLDKKLMHFGYFYLIWLLIQMPLRLAVEGGLTPGGFAAQFAHALIVPYGPLWFIYALPLMFIVTKLLRFVPGPLLFIGAAAMQIFPLHTGWGAIDYYATHYYVYFVAGYLLAPQVFAVARWAHENVAASAGLLIAWAVLNGILVFSPSPVDGFASIAQLPVVSLGLGGLGALAMVTAASLLAKFDVARVIRYCGANSIVLYVSFAVPMAVARMVLLKIGIITDTGVASLVVWLSALIGPLVVHMLVRGTPLRFLYERPRWFGLPHDEKPSKADRDGGRQVNGMSGLGS